MRALTSHGLGAQPNIVPTKFSLTFTETLRALMDAKGLRQVDLQSELISKAYLSKLLRGNIKEPTWRRACAMIDALGISLDEFRALQLQGGLPR
ncbi:helix-turn-helix domain protein [Coriobacterium glomerans PW2]|uniref:Helix-turn-helix domain protein n=1 Tax=Coriobacterium glomerans (strain ATCC 49209 / DSM 20642 / JCM 10262 / PW2) TaxID=700015 RepID=F2N8J8_CORGP|nr:helix-turn-helix domain protein [Coriobacterium glomerans PW2]